MTKTRTSIIAAILSIGALLTGGIYWINQQRMPEFERVTFKGGDHKERTAIGELILAIRNKEKEGIVQLDGGDESYRKLGVTERGAKWLIDHHSQSFNAPLRAAFREGENSVLSTLACISPGQGRGLYVIGHRRTESGPYRLSISSYGQPSAGDMLLSWSCDWPELAF